MKARLLRITEKLRSHPISIVKPTDFSSEPTGQIEAAEVLSDPRFSLYCFDLASDAALFVEADDPEAIEEAPFYYQAQADHAVGLASMPMDVFHRAGASIPRPEGGIAFIHSVGRCGSTLVSKVLATVPGVKSLSEPDDLTQLVNLWAGGTIGDDVVGPLLQSSVRWRCKGKGSVVAIKPRSEVMVLADFIGAAFPREKHLFLYRNAVDWMRSLYRGWPADKDVYDLEQNRKMADSWALTLPLFAANRVTGETPNAIQIRMWAWITGMEGYLRLRRATADCRALRFEDLTASSCEALAKASEFLGIRSVDWDKVGEVLGKDSQAGTIYDREKRRFGRELPEELIQDVRELVTGRDLLGIPEVVLEGTL